MTARRHVVHLVYRFSVGGLENVVAQLVNRLPPERFDHTLLSLTTIDGFRDRITRPGVRFVELNKPPGHAVALYPRVHRLLREWRPDVLHSCNLAALELAPVAWAARVPLRVHAEHGWDAHDPQGRNPRYRWLRRAYRPFVSQYVSVSRDLDDYLDRAVGVPAGRRRWIPNGVDTRHFMPAAGPAPAVPGCPFVPGTHWLVGTVGRLQTVKNQPLLARAFVALLQARPDLADRARLVLVGDGPLRADVEAVLDAAGLRHLAWLPGARDDVADLLRMLDVFVLPSQAEGMSCTLQEAMATGLPVVATAVGGTPELVTDGEQGWLVPSDDAPAMAQALARLATNAAQAQAFGLQARERAVARFGLDAMVADYDALFTHRAVAGSRVPTQPA